MSTGESPTKQGDECQVAIEAAMGVAFDHCATGEDINRNIGRILGVEPDVNCKAALKEGLDSQTCADFRGLRQWVMCRAQALISEEEISFSEAMEAAWQEAHDGCDAEGVIV